MSLISIKINSLNSNTPSTLVKIQRIVSSDCSVVATSVEASTIKEKIADLRAKLQRREKRK